MLGLRYNLYNQHTTEQVTGDPRFCASHNPLICSALHVTCYNSAHIKSNGKLLNISKLTTITEEKRLDATRARVTWGTGGGEGRMPGFRGGGCAYKTRIKSFCYFSKSSPLF